MRAPILRLGRSAGRPGDGRPNGLPPAGRRSDRRTAGVPEAATTGGPGPRTARGRALPGPAGNSGTGMTEGVGTGSPTDDLYGGDGSVRPVPHRPGFG